MASLITWQFIMSISAVKFKISYIQVNDKRIAYPFLKNDESCHKFIVLKMTVGKNSGKLWYKLKSNTMYAS